MSNFITETLNKLTGTFNLKKYVGRGLTYVVDKYINEYTNVSDKNLQWVSFYPVQELKASEIYLKPKAVNNALEGAPFEVVEGYVDQILTRVPWNNLNKSPTTIYLKDVDITVRPKAPSNKAAQLLEAMSASMIHSMDSSIRFAEQTWENEAKSHNSAANVDQSTKNECVSLIAEQIEKVKQMLHVTFENVTIRMEVVEDGKLVGLEIHIDKAEYFDDAVAKAEEAEGEEGKEDSSSMAWLTKNIRVMGVTFSLDDQPVPFNFPSGGAMPDGCDSMGTSPQELYVSALAEAQAEGESVLQDDTEEGDPPRAIPVPIGIFAGRSDLKITMKGNETVEGPAVDVSAHLGALHTLLSPKQLGLLIKIVTSFLCPSETGSEYKTGALNWRMGPEDYATVGQVLEDNMRSGQFEEVMQTFPEDCNYLGTGDPMFHTMETGAVPGVVDMNLSISSLDSATTLNTIPRSVTPEMERRHQEKTAKKVRESAARAANDPSSDHTRVQGTVATVSVCLLHEELQESGSGGRGKWAHQMEQLATTYFRDLRAVSTAGQQSLKDFRDSISQIVQRDHLGLLCKPVTVSVRERRVRGMQSWLVEARVHQAELVECLLGSGPQQGACFQETPPLRIPQYCQILTFSNAHTATTAEAGFSRDSLVPAIQVDFATNSKTGPGGHTYRETKVKVDLGNLVTELDITIQDRLSTLITTLTAPPKTSASGYSQPLGHMDQHFGFEETLQDATLSNHALDFSLSSQHATARIRFPIPNLRPADQHAPREWWGRNLHKESLLLEVDQLSLLTYSSPEQPASSPACVELMCSKMEVYFQEDFNKTPRLFGSIMQGSGDVGDNFNRPRVVIKKFPPMGTSLMTTFHDDSYMEGSTGGLGQSSTLFSRAGLGSTPFTQKKEILHGTQPFDGDDQKGFDSSFERVAPGNKEEMLKFVDMSTSNTCLLVEITAPKVLVLLHDKQFLELLYNRINNDLLLWEPQSPSPPEAFASGQSLNIQPQYLHPEMLGSMGESTYSNNGSDEDLPSATSQPNTTDSTSVRQPSHMCLALNIGEGKLFTCVPVKQEDGNHRDGMHGELALVVKDGTMFISVGHEGNKDLRFLTIGANRAQLFHAGCVADNLTAPVTMETLDTLTFESKGCLEHLTSRIVRSEPSVPIEPLTDVGTGESSEDMVSLAVQIKIEGLDNCKFFDVAVGIKGATLRHEKHQTGEGWISQLMDLVDLKDYPIEGYVMPHVLTNLNMGLTGCAVDYRPKNFELMKLRSLLTVEKFSLAVNLNTNTTYTSMKFLFDEVSLWLSDKDVVQVNVPKDYLRIAQVGILEVGLRLGQAIEKGSKTLLWFGNNRIEFKVCYDSFTAFMYLLDHFINDRDLVRPQEADSVPAEEMPNLNLDERTEAQNLHVEESIADALQEQRTPSTSPKDSPVKEGDSGRPLYFMPPVEGMATEQGQGFPVSEMRKGAACLLASELSAPKQDITVSVDEGDGEEFTIIDDPGMGIAPRFGETRVKYYCSPEELRRLSGPIVWPKTTNTSADDLRTPAGWPVPEFKVILRELNLYFSIYEGNDFGPKKETDKEGKKKGKQDKYMFRAAKAEEAAKHKKPTNTANNPGSRPLHWKGGLARNEELMVQLVVYKFRLQYERYDESEERSRRLVVVARKVEIEDHLAKDLSSFNKLLYWPGYDVSYEGSNMVRIKFMWERPDPRYKTEEVSVRFTLQHIKCNVNQNTLVFIQKFISNVFEECSSVSSDDFESSGRDRDPSPSPSHTPRRKKSVSAERAPIFSTEGGEPRQELRIVVDDSLMHFEDDPNSRPQSKFGPERPPRIDVEPEDNPTFFKSFVMTRNTPLTLCYTGTGAGIKADNIKTIAYTTIQGVVQLENVNLTLKQLELKKGYKGISKLWEAIQQEWGKDIRSRQVSSVVGGIGPFHIISIILQGLLDFFKMPYDQYKKDGRVWRGLQKGAVSLKVATQTAFLDLLKKLIDSIMVCSSVCFDVLSSSKNPNRIRDLSKTPKDLREGMSGAVMVVREGITGTLSDLVRDASQQREQKGLPGAMGYIVKNIPATLCAMPVQVLSAGAGQCVTGIRHEVRPDLLKEAQEKYKELN